MTRHVKIIFSGLGVAAATLWSFDRSSVNIPDVIGKPTPTGPKWNSNWDNRSVNTWDQNNNEVDKDEVIPKPTATRHLFLIRHGQYEMNRQTDQERKLTELGREQALLTGRRLNELSFPYTVILSSTMTRALETADLIATQLKPGIRREVSPLLQEGAPIPPEPPIGHWHPADQQYNNDGIRIESAFQKYFHRSDVSQKEDSYEVIVCHANVIRYFVCRALQFPPEGWLRINLHNASITWITIRPSGRVVLRVLGDSGHIPPHQITSN